MKTYLWTRFRMCCVLGVLGLVLAKCASGPRVSPYTPSLQDPGKDIPALKGLKDSEERELKAIQQAFLRAETEELRNRVSAFEKHHSKSRALSRVYNYLGLGELQARRPLQAGHAFRKALTQNKESAFKPYLLYNLAACQYELGQFQEAGTSLTEINAQSLAPVNRFKFYYLRGLISQKKNETESSLEDFFRAGQMLVQSGGRLSQQQGTLEKNVQASLDKITDPTRVEKLLKTDAENPLVELLLFQLGMMSIRTHKSGLAENYFRQFIARFPQSRNYAEAVDQLRSIQNLTLVDARTIGVLLPMTGRFGKFGQQSLKAIELGVRVFQQERRSDPPVTLVIEDSGETPEEALEALERLYYTHQVVAVIGPLLSRGIEKVTLRAQELGLPLISLAPQTGAKGDFVFQMQSTPRDQAYEIAQYAMKVGGMKRFAILFPKDKFGQEYSQHFWDSVDELGGEVVAAEGYTPGETDFRSSVDKLVGLAYPDARRMELETLADIRKKKNIIKKTSKTQRYFDLDPLVNFDAVFIPDDARSVGQILPTFAFRDVDSLRYLGIGTWNSKDLLRRAQGFTEGALFVDAFFPSGSAPETMRFVQQFRKTFEENPSVQEATAFEAAAVLDSILSSFGHNSVKRSDIRERLTLVKDFEGATGRLTYDAGRFVRTLKILIIQNGHIGEAPAVLPPLRAPGKAAERSNS